MQALIEEIKDQILKEREWLVNLEKDPTVSEKKVKTYIVKKKIDLLRNEAYELARKTHHPCPLVFLYFGEHDAKYGVSK